MKYPGSIINVIGSFRELHPREIPLNSILICNDHSVIFSNLEYFSELMDTRQIKSVLLANSTQLELLKDKDIRLINALISTNCSPTELNDALGMIQAGLTYRCKHFMQEEEPELDISEITKNNNISAREMEIIRLVIEGKTSYEIADKLCISYNTVTTHRRNINKKLNVNRPQDLMRIAMGLLKSQNNG